MLVTRADAAVRALTTLQFLWRLPQGTEATGLAGDRGFFYHFLDMETGLRYRNTELSSIDTALLLAGMAGIGVWVENQIEAGVIHNTGATAAHRELHRAAAARGVAAAGRKGRERGAAPT